MSSADEDNARRASVAMATQYADEEQRRRIQEAYYAELDAKDEQEEARQIAMEMAEHEQRERIRAYHEGEEAPRREYARRASLQLIHDAFGWNRSAREDLSHLDEEDAFVAMEEESERKYRERLAHQMAEQERQRRVAELLEEEESIRRDAQEYAATMWEQERQEQIAEHENQGHHKQGQARRSSLALMMEAEGSAFQRQWAEHNWGNSEDDEDDMGPTTKQLFEMEQESHARELELALREDEAEARLQRIDAMRQQDEEQARRMAEDDHMHGADIRSQLANAASRSARRRSVTALMPEQDVEEPEMTFDEYQYWAEETIHGQQEDLFAATNLVNQLQNALEESNAIADKRMEMLVDTEDQLYHTMSELQTVNAARQETEDIANNNYQAAFEREEQLQLAMQEIRGLQSARSPTEVEDELNEVYGQLERLRVNDHELEDRMEKTERMLEEALIELQRTKRDRRRELERRSKVEEMLQKSQSDLSAARRKLNSLGYQ